MREQLSAREFSALVEEVAPLQAAYDWDNSGYNIKCHDRVQKVLVCLDVTENVLREAESGGYDTILSHHPLLFHGTKQLWQELPVSAIAMQAVRQGCNVYCAHTSFDCAPGGMNRILAERLGLQRIMPWIVEKQSEDGQPMAVLGSIGELPTDMTAAEFAAAVKEKLEAPSVQYVPQQRKVRRVVCLGGAGGDYVVQAAQMGVDAFVTGEVKHNVYQEAGKAGIVLCEAGHYDTEKGFVAHMCLCLQKRFSALQYNITVDGSKTETRPYHTV